MKRLRIAALLLASAAGCGKRGSGDEPAAVTAETKASTPAAAGSAATPAGAAGHAPAHAKVALVDRAVTLPETPLLFGSLLVGEGATLARLELRVGKLVEIPPPGPGLRLFPTTAVHGTLLAGIAILDRGEEHAEQLALVDLADLGKPALLVGPTGQVVRNPSFAADGKSLVLEASHRSFRDLYRLTLPAAGATGPASLGETTPLTDNREGNFAPALSPDGKQLAFASSRDGDSELYAMELGSAAAGGPSGAGGGAKGGKGAKASARRAPAAAASAAAGGDPALPPVRRLTAFHRDDWGPTWNPSRSGGGELAFLSDREGIDRIFIVNGDGTGLHRATAEAEAKAVEASPAWSSQGALAYLRTAANRVELRAGAPGTDSWVSLTPPHTSTESFAWSPDGKWLAMIESDEAPAAAMGAASGTQPAPAARRAHADHGRLVVSSADGKQRFTLLGELAPEATLRWIP